MAMLSRIAFCAVLVLLGACSMRQAGINRMAAALADSGRVYEADNDPEFVRLAAPSTLKTVEMLLSQSPDNPQLLLTACSGFTEYSYAFLHVEGEITCTGAAAARDLRDRAVRMYARARGYCHHGLQARHPGLTAAALARDPAGALSVATKDDVPLLYWTGASWAAELSLAPNQLARAGELLPVRALLARARALDERWDHGAIFEALIAVDGLPALAGGSPAAARADFEKALQLSEGKSVFAYVAYAGVVSDKAERRRLLEQAVAMDANAGPRRLTNLIAQRYARAVLTAAAPGSPAGR